MSSEEKKGSAQNLRGIGNVPLANQRRRGAGGADGGSNGRVMLDSEPPARYFIL